MEGLGLVGLLILGSLLMVVVTLARQRHTSSDEGFLQAGVGVNYQNETIRIKGQVYPAEAVRSVRWESGHGPRGNASIAFIELDDMRRPVHQVTFITPNAAQTFVSRLTLALQKCGVEMG